MNEENYEVDVPRSDGRFHNLVRIAGAGGPKFDASHTDHLDNFTAMEVTLKSRCHGHPLEAMAYPITPIGMHYLLIHYDIPFLDAATHRLQVQGLVDRRLSLGIDDLRQRPRVTMPVTLECCGNGRMSMRNRLWPHVPWNHEAIGTAEWTGTPLRGVLAEAGIRPDAVDVVFTGLDKGIQGEQVQHFRRSLSVEHAMSDEVLLAYEINGQPLPPQHGYPLRLIVPGWLGMASVKWLGSIELIDRKLTDQPDEMVQHGDLRRRPGARPLHAQQGPFPDDPPRHPRLLQPVPLAGGGGPGGASRPGLGRRRDRAPLGRSQRRWGQARGRPRQLEAPLGPFAWSGWTFAWNETSGRGVTRCSPGRRTKPGEARISRRRGIITRWTTRSLRPSTSKCSPRGPWNSARMSPPRPGFRPSELSRIRR